MTPTITNDNRVFLNMQVKKDEVDRLIELQGYGTVPSINRRGGQHCGTGRGWADRGHRWRVRVHRPQQHQQVPFLGDVPFLGNLFEARPQARDKAELLVFVTPKVLRVAKQN